MTGGNRDIWMAAYTPEISVSVWMGFDQRRMQIATSRISVSRTA